MWGLIEPSAKGIIWAVVFINVVLMSIQEDIAVRAAGD